MRNKIVAFIPIKLNNERFPGKNLKQFADGKVLLTYFLERIVQVKHIDEFYVFCSDESIKPYLIPKVSFLKRPKSLDSQETTSQDIINDFMDKVDADIYCLCHCTSPFCSLEHFNQTIESLVYGDFDSAFTAKKIQKHLWKEDKNALNFDPQNIPRTQDLPILYEEIPAIFAFRKEIFKNFQRRVGFNPYIVEVDEIESVDIDYPQEFYIANAIYMHQGGGARESLKITLIYCLLMLLITPLLFVRGRKMRYSNIKALIPLQLASTRVKLKNIRPFYQDKSLFDIKIKQLIDTGLNPNKIYVSSEDAENIVKKACAQYGANFLQRDKSLTGNAIKQSDLIGFILNQIPKDNDDILWVQVTNPLFDKFQFILDSWQEIQAQGCDSIVAVKTIRHHLLNQSGIPLNFNFGNWHKVSQDLPKIYEILWSAFLLKREAIETNKYHIGLKPYYMPFDNITTIDIDTEKDFELARQYYALINGGGGGKRKPKDYLNLLPINALNYSPTLCKGA